MKIGILTFHETTNFGALLHTIALYRKIYEINPDVEILNYKCDYIRQRELTSEKKINWRNPKQVISNFLWGKHGKRKELAFNKTLSELTKVGKPYYIDDIYQANQEYDKFIVGSDTVWMLSMTNNDYTFFLDFVEDNNKKYAFSSSVGHSVVDPENKRLGELLSGFKTITVREEDAVKWVYETSHHDATWVCDPTMLLTKSEWEELIPPTEYNEDEDYVLVYFRDNEGVLMNDAYEYAKANNCKIKFINYNKPVKGTETARPYTLNEFLGLIKHSKFIFTASYHGLLFGLYFNKQMRFYNRGGKSRMISLSNRLGLQGMDGFEIPLDKYKTIDYKEINENIQQFRDESLKILKDIVEA